LHARIDVEANRRAKKWTCREQFGRLLWGLACPLFRFSPRPFWAWRRGLLRFFGARVGSNVHIYPTVLVTIPWNLDIADYAAVGDRAILYALGTIRIGRGATVSQGAHLCAGTHDYIDAQMPLLKPPIVIGNEAWICADAFVGPGVTIGNRTIVGARAVIMKDAPESVILAGNPARVIKRRDSEMLHG
jgi:putative colanic acid biosynthesis acetyltransferase WcaF